MLGMEWMHRCWECGENTRSQQQLGADGRFRWNPPVDDFYAKHAACNIKEENRSRCYDHQRAFPKGTNCPECEAAGFVCESMGGDGVPRRFPNRNEFELAAWKREQIECQPEGDYLRVACCDCGSKRHKLTRYTRHGMDKTGINWVRCGECDKAMLLRGVKPNTNHKQDKKP